MGRRAVFLLTSFLCLVSLAGVSGCSAKADSLQEKYGYDTSYFMGLRSLQMGDITTGRRQLRSAAKKASPIIARRAKEELAATADGVDDRIDALLSIWKEYGDDDALSPLAEALFDNREYAKLISETDSIDLTAADNKIVFYRLSAMNIKKDSRFDREYSKWCMSRPYTSWHYDLYNEVETNPSLITFRAFVYRRNYASAFNMVKDLLSNPLFLSAQTASDFGKAFLYGSPTYDDNARFMEEKVQKIPAEYQFYFHFYAGRMYDKANDVKSASECYLKAMEAATSDELYDNALWYYLTSLLNDSVDTAAAAVETFRQKWHDSAYFDNFFDSLSCRLLVNHRWQSYCKVAEQIDGYASKEVRSKYFYIASRLIEEGLLSRSKTGADSELEEKRSAFLAKSLDSGTSLYYKFLAARALSLDETQLKKALSTLRIDEDFADDDTGVEKLLLGYADFGFAERIFPEWTKNPDAISLPAAEKLASFLQSCGKINEIYYTQSIRIASRKLNNSEIPLPEDSQLYKLSFPRGFESLVSQYAREHSLNDWLLYALIRSESFFAPKVISSAGAIGLTQLMEQTAGDIARKLKVEKYDLTDSETNIRFGSFYLAEMIRRLDGSILSAAFAYNAGITRVRNWFKSAVFEYNKEQVPMDLFLESVPYEETREYGRKIVSASAMYAMLYNNLSLTDVLAAVVK